MFQVMRWVDELGWMMGSDVAGVGVGEFAIDAATPGPPTESARDGSGEIV